MCCINLACNMHRDTARIVNKCSNMLQRGTCAKNTVRFLKNDPSLACPLCTVRNIQLTVPLPSENRPCDNDRDLVAVVRDDSDLERSWAENDVWQPLIPSQVQVPSIPSRSRPTSKQLDFQLPSYLQLEGDNLGELSHEDGIKLIDEMYGAENLDYGIRDMDMSDDEQFNISAETHYDLKQAHAMTSEIENIIQSDQKGAVADACICLPHQYGGTPTKVDEKRMEIEAFMLRVIERLDGAQQVLDKLRRTRQEIGYIFYSG